MTSLQVGMLADDLRLCWVQMFLELCRESVCIVYLHATGSGVGPYAQDITAWRDLYGLSFSPAFLAWASSSATLPGKSRSIPAM